MRTFAQVSRDWEKMFTERLPAGPGGLGIENQIPLLEECLEEKDTTKYDNWRKKQLDFFVENDLLT